MKSKSSSPRSTPDAHCVDVLIIGGGPAGSTAGAWLAQHGCRALICEKEQFPRFHIGESLLPNGNNILKEIGVWEKIEAAGFIKKYGAEFTLPDRSRSVANTFSDGLIPDMEHTYQVERSRFDEILLNHAADSGCEVRQRTTITPPTRTTSGWSATTKDLASGNEQTITARWIIDASGRHCVMGRALQIKKETIPYPGRFSIFNHFEGCTRDAGKAAGNIIITRLEDAWFWSIPISETVTSVGIVAQSGARSTTPKETREAFFWRKVAESPFLTQSLSNAKAVEPFRIDSDYCFAYETFGTEQVLLTGDAASFIDPVFSSGVYLALESGRLAAKTIHQQLSKGTVPVSPTLYKTYTKSMTARVQTMRRLIETYYDNKTFEVFMSPKAALKLPRALNSILAGCPATPFKIRWRLWLFLQICARHKKRPIADPICWHTASQTATDPII